ncbi:MAG TPA: pectinesterase family protein [Kofleriaceae bacterium]
MPFSQRRFPLGQLRSWAAPIGLGLLTLLGCSADGESALEAPITPADPLLPAEPTIPAACAGATLDAPHAVRATGDARTDGLPIYDPSALDTAAIQAAIEACGASLAAGDKGSVRLRVNPSDSTRVAFVSGPLFLRAGVTLWIDAGVTLFAAQDPRLYDARGPGTCGTDANNTSSGCLSLINVNGASATALLADAGVMGDGVIDGLGGEPMIGGFNGNPNGTWWDVAQHAKPIGFSHSNPRLIDVLLANRFTLYRVTLHNSPKFHVGLESDNYLVWGVTVQTPSRAVNSVGRRLNPAYARNTDGIDPSDSWNGVIAYSNISVGDDQIAIKCGKYHMNTVANADQPSCRNLTVAHVHFGTGHGMSIGSETNGGPNNDSHQRIGMAGERDPVTQRVLSMGLHVYDLSIDGSIGTGGAPDVDINGIRIKSDVSRGGLVKDILYENICIRNLPNPIILNPHYDPSKTGTLFPTYQNIVLKNIHAVRSTSGSAPQATPVVTLLGLNQTHRTGATLNNVVVDGIAASGVMGQYADIRLGPGPVNFMPRDNVSPPGSPSTVTVTTIGATTNGPPPPPVSCTDRFSVPFPDYGNDVSLDNNASLRSLALVADGTPIVLGPAFSSAITTYTATVPFRTQTVTIAPTINAARVSAITVAQDGGPPVTVASGGAVALALPPAGGTSLVTVGVRAEDGVFTTSYRVAVSRTAAGTDARLAALSDSANALAFDPAQTSYAYSVPAALATGYTVTPTARDPSATILVNGAPVASGTPSGTIDLSAGAATVAIAVLAEDGVTSITYTLDITVSQATVPVTGVALSAASLRLDTTTSTTAVLVATLSPPGATDRAVTGSSSNPAVATVAGAGPVRAVAAGQSTITVTSHDGGFTASCSIRVFALFFSDDFEAGSGQWDLLPIAGPNGSFSVATDGSSVLKYTAGNVGGVLALVKDTAWSSVGTGNYYVEARIKPQTNSTTGNKQLYLIARYQDPTNWYAAGLNVQSSTASTQVEIAKMSAGSLSRPGQTRRPISMDTWYTVRFELSGSSLSVYLDGELIRTVTDTAFTSGKIGLFTANKSFELDDVRVGDPIDRPVQLTINPGADWAAEAGDAPRLITVTAQKPDYVGGGYLPDTFGVTSSDPTVVSASVVGTSVTLTPLRAGTATIRFTSGTDPALTRSVTAAISPPFVQSTTIYDLTGRTTPAAAASSTYADTRLAITFDAPPALGAAGSVRIFRKSDDALVDVIKPGAETDAIGFPGQDQLRVVNLDGLIAISGTTATIVPHHGRLAYGTEYYVAIANGVLAGTALNGTTFDGIGRIGNWSFTTRPQPPAGLTSVVVDDDGPADFRTVQGALDHVMKNAGRDTPVTINVRNGTYRELLFLRAKNNVSIVGESRDGVIIQYRNYEALNSGSGASQAAGSGSPGGGRAVFLVEISDLLTLDTLTLQNTMLRSTSASSQAETVYFNNDAGRLVARNASFLSEQDTLQLKGYAWFFQSLVAGNVDFIWGNNRVALFEDCEIRSVGDTTSTTSGGYVVQARSVSAADKGFVFLNSRLTHGPGPGPAAGDVPTGTGAATYLARSPGGTASFDNVAFINCQMDNHIIPVGWAYNTAGQPIPNPAVPTAASGWREFGTTDLGGAPVNLATRVGGDLLTASDVATGFASRAQIFAAFGGGAGWNPQP